MHTKSFAVLGATAVTTLLLGFAQPIITPVAADNLELTIEAKANFTANGIAVTKNGTKFVSMPRFPGNDDTYSLGLVEADGSVVPFPGDHWNAWDLSEENVADAFVSVNAVHIFDDDTLWAVDSGAFNNGTVITNGSKLVQFDPATRSFLQVLHFNDTILPAGASMNDLRIHNDTIFATDSGIGGIIIHNLVSNMTLRRLSNSTETRIDPSQHPMQGAGGKILLDPTGARPVMKSDQLEVDSSGTWFYYSNQADGLKRVLIADLLNTSLDDEQLATKVELYSPIPSTDGTAMDSLGNFYVSDMVSQSVFVISAKDKGVNETLVRSSKLISPDALFIDTERRLYIPCPENELLPAWDDGLNEQTRPFYIYSIQLPERVGNINLGNQLD